MSEQKDKQKPMPNIMFRLISATATAFYKLVDIRKQVVGLGVREGQTVLDFGCGSGYFSIAAAKIVGERGKVYALDIHPLAVKAIEKKIARERLTNVITILSDRDTGLPDESVDVILLYRTFQYVKDKKGLLQELHRVIKPTGNLLVRGGNLKRCLKTIEKDSHFSLSDKHRMLLNFRKIKAD